MTGARFEDVNDTNHALGAPMTGATWPDAIAEPIDVSIARTGSDRQRDPAAASWSVGAWRWNFALAQLVVVAGAGADAFLIQPSLDRVLGAASGYSLAFAAIIAVLSAVLAYDAGAVARAEEANWTGWLRALIVAWVALGVGMFILRMVAAPQEIAALKSTWTREIGSAAMLLLVYGAVGVGAAIAGWRFGNPALKTLMRARVALARLGKQLESLEPEYVTKWRALGTSAHTLKDVNQVEQDAITEVRHVIADLRTYAKLRIAEKLANPAATGLVREDLDVVTGTDSDTREPTTKKEN